MFALQQQDVECLEVFELLGLQPELSYQTGHCIGLMSWFIGSIRTQSSKLSKGLG